jgi:hypothetical protein
MRRVAREAALFLLLSVLLTARPIVQGYEGGITVTNEDYVKAIACLLAEREEQTNGTNGMLGVLFVLRNRVNAGWFKGDWLANISARNQFSSMTVLGDAMTIKYQDPREPAFQKVVQMVDQVYDGSLPDMTAGALYYADLNSPGFVKGGWFDKTILANPDKFPRVAQIGTTTYFGQKP